MSGGLRVTIWNEGVHERTNEAVAKVYPEGLGGQIAKGLAGMAGVASVRQVELASPAQGLDAETLDLTDVLVWWGHMAHHEVTEENAERVRQRVLNGMGFVVLHSACQSKPFMRLMGTTCAVRWREWQGIGERERIWTVDPAHPITEGLPPHFEVPRAEMYGEHFDIPQPDEQVFISWFQGGEVFRSGCCWHRGRGKVFYFRPGHETFPVYHDATVLRVIYNGVKWAAPAPAAGKGAYLGGQSVNVEPLEDMG